jgi:hypothetical protein
VRDAFTKCMPVKGRVWCGRWNCHACGPQRRQKPALRRAARRKLRALDRREWREQDEPANLWWCVMCPDGREWVGDYDAADLLGECPTCRSGVGVFEVEHDFPRDGTAGRRRVEIVAATGAWDTLDSEHRRWLGWLDRCAA